MRIEGIPQKVEATVGPDFEKAAKVCSEYYGAHTPLADQCFLNYQTFFNLKIQPTPGNVDAYCEGLYTDPVEIQHCQESIDGLFGNGEENTP